MTVEFALRPRIRLREASPRPKRSRVRLPRFALPVALYWAVAGGITYAFVHEHDTHPSLASGALDEPALAAEPAARESRPWWRLAPKAPAPEPAQPSAEPAPEPALSPGSASAPPEVEANDAPVPRSPDALETASGPSTRPEPEAPPDAVDARAISRALLAEPTRPTRSTRTPLPAPPSRSSFDDLPAFSEAPAFVDAPAAPTPAPLARAEVRSSRLPSCEAAIESAHQDVDFSQGNGTADLPTSAIAAVLENGAWLASCGVPASTSLDVCVAIRGGNVIGVSVASRPANAELSACVRRRASSLQFPYSSHVDIARTRF